MVRLVSYIPGLFCLICLILSIWVYFGPSLGLSLSIVYWIHCIAGIVLWKPISCIRRQQEQQNKCSFVGKQSMNNWREPKLTQPLIMINLHFSSACWCSEVTGFLTKEKLFLLIQLHSIKVCIVSRLNLVKLRFSKNTNFIIIGWESSPLRLSKAQ